MAGFVTQGVRSSSFVMLNGSSSVVAFHVAGHCFHIVCGMRFRGAVRFVSFMSAMSFFVAHYIDEVERSDKETYQDDDKPEGGFECGL